MHAIRKRSPGRSPYRTAIFCVWRETYGPRNDGGFPTLEANLAHISRALGVEAEPDATRRAAQLRFEITRPVMRPRNDAIDTLTRLRRSGHKIGLVSNCSPEVPALWP